MDIQIEYLYFLILDNGKYLFCLNLEGHIKVLYLIFIILCYLMYQNLIL